MGCIKINIEIMDLIYLSCREVNKDNLLDEQAINIFAKKSRKMINCLSSILYVSAQIHFFLGKFEIYCLFNTVIGQYTIQDFMNWSCKVCC